MAVWMGIDPGSLHLGYGVIQTHGVRLEHLGHGTLTAPKSQAIERRLALLHRQLCEVLDRYRPDGVALEKVFSARNPRSALSLGQARGMILVAVGERELPLAEYSPSEVKLAVVGHGGSGKDQVAAMAGRLLGIATAREGRDSTDALAVAICHAHRGVHRRFLQQVEGRSSRER